MQTLATTITTVEKTIGLLGEPKTGPRNNEDAQGEKKQVREGEEEGQRKDEDIQGKQRQCQANRHNEREEVDFMLDLCQGALCKELSLETEVECFGEGRQPICWSLVGLEHCHGG
jgi:hypothetical protein